MATPVSGQRILIVEESATLRYILGNLAQKRGYELLAVDSFQSAIETLEHVTQNLHGVLLGWPQSEDHEDAKHLLVLLEREPYSDLPVILLSNDAELEILNWTSGRKSSAMVPWESYQEAIVSLQVMLDPMSSLDFDSSGMFPAMDAKPTRVLFVDDSRSIVTYYSRLLKRHGYQVDVAYSVQEAYELALQKTFDIAIVDYFMPDENGYVLCKKLRDNPETANIRTAVITGTYLDSVIRDCLKAGAVECMFKNEVEELFIARVVAMSRFIEVQRSTEKQRESLQAILESVGEGVYGVDKEGCITFANPATLRVLGIDNAQVLIGEFAQKVFHYDDDVIGMDGDRLLHAYAKGEELRSWETQFRHKSGKPIPVECTLYPLNLNGKKEGSVIAFRDISNQKMLEERLRWQATHDHLTELHNRRYFESKLEAELNQVQRRGISSAIVYLDLDHFKYVNDTMGHDAGDQLLIDIGRTLTRQLRRNDLVARIGGDEFALILKNVDESLAVSLADEFREILTGMRVHHEEKNYHIQASIGVAMIDSEDETAGDVLANSDIACHMAKQAGRNQTHLYEKTSDDRNAMGSELGWSARLREALQSNGFVLHYQPILDMEAVDLNTLPAQDGLLWQQHIRSHEGSFCYEALIRMKSETGELHYPNAFIPTAERFGLMVDVDMWVVEHAMQDMLATGYPKDRISLSLNLSGNTLDNDEAADRIKALIGKYNIDPGILVFEVTETSAIANIDQANRFISELSSIGCHFSLDDFGSGFCSFSQLKSLPSDFVKIDGQFVKSMARGSTDRAIVTAMNDVAHSLDRATVAEFVESPEIVRLLKICGVDKVQGNYISPPLEALPHGNVVKLHTHQNEKQKEE